PNAAIDGTLLAQRFNNTALKTWGDWLAPSGHDNTAFGAGTGQVTTFSQIGTANFFRSWTLSDKNAPLPINLESFTAECNNYYALLQWKTASESNNDYFTIDRTQDGVHFETVAVIKGSGTTSAAHSYSTIDYTPLSGTSYYRISQTDFDGVTTNLNTVVYVPCENSESVNAFTVNNNTIDVQINSNSIDTYTFTIMNALGQVILTQAHNVSVGLNDFKINPQVARGIYILQIVGKEKVYSKKLALGAL
ncbi:MAG TPA: T9SS type A sorting domain-containing protein, partial [Bacteroidia bacterium]|nr:T9SS type A sorting domain-containing protein [Bacteroidia bacterium]